MDLDGGLHGFLDCWIFGPIDFSQVNPNMESIQQSKVLVSEICLERINFFEGQILGQKVDFCQLEGFFKGFERFFEKVFVCF